MKEKSEVIIQLLIIHYLLLKYQDTDETIDEAAIEAINTKAEGEEITLKFS